MYVQDFTGDPSELLDAAFSLPKLHPKKNPDYKTATRVIGDTVAKVAKSNISKEVYTDVMDAVAMYEIMNGDYADLEGDEYASTRDDYESGMDDKIEEALEKYNDYLSADWLGKNTVETGLWNSTDADRSLIEAFADNAAEEVFKQLTHEKTPAQILASAGVTAPDVSARLAKQSEEGHMMTNPNTLEAVIEKIKLHVGKDFDQMTVYEDIETIVDDDDEILAASAAGRVGLSKDDMDVLQLASLDMDDAAAEIVELVAAFKPKSAAQVKKEQKAAKSEAKADAAASGVAALVFANLKDCGAGDTALAEELGVSRSTYVNYCKGKTALVPDEAQYGVLRREIVDRANKMLAALAALDGSELTQVM